MEGEGKRATKREGNRKKRKENRKKKRKKRRKEVEGESSFLIIVWFSQI
jgi:hypothetical protein